MASSEIFQSGCVLHLNWQMPKLIIYRIYYKMLFLTVKGNNVLVFFLILILENKKRKHNTI